MTDTEKLAIAIKALKDIQTQYMILPDVQSEIIDGEITDLLNSYLQIMLLTASKALLAVGEKYEMPGDPNGTIQ